MENINQSSINQQELSGYFKDPEGISISDEKVIESLVERYPYAQMLHAFEAKCHDEGEKSDAYLEKAALYIPERNILYNIIHKPESFRNNTTDKSEISSEAAAVTAEDDYSEITVQENDNEQANLSLPEPALELDTTEAEKYNSSDDIEIENEISDDSDPAISSDLNESDIITDNAAEIQQEIIENPEPGFNEQAQVEEPEEISTEISEDFQTSSPSPDIQNEQGFQDSASATERIITEDQPDAGPSESPADETQQLILGNIAASDFFRFEEKLDDQLTSHPDSEPIHESAEDNKKSDIPELKSAQGVSKYDDDKMPYTFLWWLNKTRKEHSATYQPYVSFKLDTTEDIKKDPAADLNHQIIENIFHLQSPLEDLKEAEKPKTVEFTVKRKDEQIIERFIREEPQIRPPKPEKLDTENKARKSSEDSYDMVSETLASVYIEQMLFHKAIDTYKKLSLKFPEKSAYFADQIRKLETTN